MTNPRARTCAYPQREITPRRFDVVRNWALLRAMLHDQQGRRHVIFTSLGIRKWLLAHAAAIGERRAVIRRAENVPMRPLSGRAHTDHMHVRIDCTLRDRRRCRCRCRKDPYQGRRRFGRIRCPRPSPTTL